MAHLVSAAGFPPLSWLCRRTVPWGTVWVTLRQEGDELRTADLEAGANLRRSRRV